MKETFLSRFTPSMMAAEALEALFVQREELARRIVGLIRDSVLTPGKQHTLVIGPRGIGKTHLVALIYHRIQSMEDLRDRMIIAWLREEEWGVTSFLDLLLRILRAIREEHNEGLTNERMEALYNMPPNAAEQAGATLLKEIVGNRTLLLISENLDNLFKGLGDEGQKRLRAYLQENPFCTILATAQSLFNGISLQTSPFYGFFRIQHLEELNLDEAARLLTNIANFEEDRELASFILTPMGRARIRAVHHLAGGNHRVYVIFSQFLTRKSLDVLVEPFMQMLDDLTPYYQARMAWLSLQQRKIMGFLCDRRGAAPVKEIARRCFMSHQTASSQLKDLREKGYVRSQSIGRESYYELREPLMRLCIEVKKNRGEPIRMLVDFLRLWHSRVELRQRLEMLQPNAAVEREYLLHAVKANEEEPEDLHVVACLKDCAAYGNKGDYQRALQAAEDLIAIRGDAADWVNQGHFLCHLERWPEALASFDKAIDLDQKNAAAWFYRGWPLDVLKRHEEALNCLDKSIELDPKDEGAWGNRGLVLRRLGRYDDALMSFNKVIAMSPKDKRGWLYRGFTFEDLGRHEDALACFEKLIEFNAKDAHAWLHRSFTLDTLGRYEEALSAVNKVIELETKNVGAWLHKSQVLMKLSRYKDALLSIDTLIAIAPQEGQAWHVKSVVLGNLEIYEEALGACNKAIELGEQSSNVFFNRAEVLLALNQWEKGTKELDDALHRFGQKSQGVDTRAIIRNLLTQTQDAAAWRARIKALVELYKKHQILVALGQGLVGSITRLLSPMTSHSAALAWVEVWKSLVSRHVEFQLPLRILDAAVRYRQSQDPRVLLELPIEERTILEQILNTQNSQQAK